MYPVICTLSPLCHLYPSDPSLSDPSLPLSSPSIPSPLCSQCLLGPNGVEEVRSFGTLSAFEQKGLDAMIPDLVAQAKKGVEFCK